MGAKGVTPAGIAQTLDATIGATATVEAYGVPAESTPVADITTSLTYIQL